MTPPRKNKPEATTKAPKARAAAPKKPAEAAPTTPASSPEAFPPTLGELDLHLAGEGRHEEIYERLGSHPQQVEGVDGVAFAVWAPNAASVSVVGDFNDWEQGASELRTLGSSGIWERFVPEAKVGSAYKYAIRTPDGEVRLKADPYATQCQAPPGTDSIVHATEYVWGDADWIADRGGKQQFQEPISVYEVHLGSWRRDPQRPKDPLSFAELAPLLAEYAVDMGFTHVELMPVMAHPFSGSWGYQVTGYFAPDARLGTPDDFRAFVDTMHQAGIGVILDWVPAHFPKDDWALARFDGTALYEHADPRRGEHADWGTLIFNTGRNEVKNFLLASALYWLREMHADGLRVDAVASMLYLDYSREAGEWIPNEFGGREDLDSVAFLREFNEVVHAREPGVISAAEESTSWPGVSQPTWLGGLGFGSKWNMGWMNDTLRYFEQDPVHRRYHHHTLTFSLMYAFSEHFTLPLSHDEVVHGKGSILSKMPGDRWQQLANVRALYAYQWCHPGKNLLFMGNEFAQPSEWSHKQSLDWHLTDDPGHGGVQSLVRELNRVYLATPALWRLDHEYEAFRWLEVNDADHNVVAFLRYGAEGDEPVACICNLSAVPHEDYRVGLPSTGAWHEVLNTDAPAFGGGGLGNGGGVHADEVPWHNQPASAALTLPPLAMIWLKPGER